MSRRKTKQSEDNIEVKINMSSDDLETLIICATRYCMGRQSYMPSLVQEICLQSLHEISDKTLAILIEDTKFQENMNMYGDERIDKPGWLIWKDKLIMERDRRKKTNE